MALLARAQSHKEYWREFPEFPPLSVLLRKPGRLHGTGGGVGWMRRWACGKDEGPVLVGATRGMAERMRAWESIGLEEWTGTTKEPQSGSGECCRYRKLFCRSDGPVFSSCMGARLPKTGRGQVIR